MEHPGESPPLFAGPKGTKPKGTKKRRRSTKKVDDYIEDGSSSDNNSVSLLSGKKPRVSASPPEKKLSENFGQKDGCSSGTESDTLRELESYGKSPKQATSTPNRSGSSPRRVDEPMGSHDSRSGAESTPNRSGSLPRRVDEPGSSYDSRSGAEMSPPRSRTENSATVDRRTLATHGNWRCGKDTHVDVHGDNKYLTVTLKVNYRQKFASLTCTII